MRNSGYWRAASALAFQESLKRLTKPNGRQRHLAVHIITTFQNRILLSQRKCSLQNVSQVQQRPSTKDHANILAERNARTLSFKTYLMALKLLNIMHRCALYVIRQPVLSHIGQTRLLTAKINPTMCDLCSQSQNRA